MLYFLPAWIERILQAIIIILVRGSQGQVKVGPVNKKGRTSLASLITMLQLTGTSSSKNAILACVGKYARGERLPLRCAGPGMGLKEEACMHGCE